MTFQSNKSHSFHCEIHSRNCNFNMYLAQLNAQEEKDGNIEAENAENHDLEDHQQGIIFVLG